MAAITATSMQGPGQRALTETTLGSGDTFSFSAGDILLLRNPTGGALSPVLTGADADTHPADGIGSVDVSTGYAVGSIAAGAARAIPLDTVRAYLAGTVTITSGTGLIAAILRQ